MYLYYSKASAALLSSKCFQVIVASVVVNWKRDVKGIVHSSSWS